MRSSDASSSLFLSAVRDNVVPNIVKSWRAAKLDWHQLLPRHNSIWERFGTPEKGQGLRLLISKEMQVTDFLTQFHESGLSVKYGHNYGALAEYSGCNSFLSTCMVHGPDKCSDDQLCSWSTAKQLCVDRGDKDADPDDAPPISCTSPMIINVSGGLRSAIPSECVFYVDQPAVFVRLDSESQAMFYHWWASWSGIVKFWEKTLGSSRNIHFFLEIINDPSFFDYFGFISNNCWRRATEGFVQVPKGACFCKTYDLDAHQSGDHPIESAKQMIDFLDLMQVEPPAARVKVGLISRRVKRFILNEYELVAAVEAMGFECVLLPLERMTLFEQMRELRSLDVLIGIHGSALDNSVFLHPGSVMVQLLPFSVEHRCSFQQSASSAKVVYQEWQLKNSSKAVFHWDLLEQANANKLAQSSKEEILRAGQRSADSRETLMFWINQDIIVPLEEWDTIVKNAVKASAAGRRGAPTSAGSLLRPLNPLQSVNKSVGLWL